MNREIKFRAIHRFGNTMVYGNLLIGVDFDGDELVQIEHTDPKDFQQWIVIPETVGQYTGLKDKNGKEIYEGDIVIDAEYPRVIGKVIFYPSYSWSGNWKYRYPMRGERTDFFSIGPIAMHNYRDGQWHWETSVEVLGNIHENPELLEGK